MAFRLMLVVAMVVATGCGDSEAPSVDAGTADGAVTDAAANVDAATNADAMTVTACAAIVGASFLSVGEYECGLGPEGVVYCNWWIRFDAGAYEWHHSDVISQENYTCADGMLEGLGSFPVSGAYDPLTRVLVWDGIDYAQQPSF